MTLTVMPFTSALGEEVSVQDRIEHNYFLVIVLFCVRVESVASTWASSRLWFGINRGNASASQCRAGMDCVL